MIVTRSISRDGAISLRGLGRIAADGNRARYWCRGSAASFVAPVRVLPRQAIAGGEVADLRAQIALLALEAALGALLGYQFDEKALDQRGERSVPLCSLGPGSPTTPRRPKGSETMPQKLRLLADGGLAAPPFRRTDAHTGAAAVLVDELDAGRLRWWPRSSGGSST